MRNYTQQIFQIQWW